MPAVPDAFAQQVADTLGPWAPVQLRRMFGGWGVFRQGRMFAVAVGGTLYLKADALSAPEFDARQLQPLRYDRKGRPVALSYREAPVEIFESPAEAVAWAQCAWDAAVRSTRPPARRRA